MLLQFYSFPRIFHVFFVAYLKFSKICRNQFGCFEFWTFDEKLSYEIKECILKSLQSFRHNFKFFAPSEFRSCSFLYRWVLLVAEVLNWRRCIAISTTWIFYDMNEYLFLLLLPWDEWQFQYNSLDFCLFTSRKSDWKVLDGERSRPTPSIILH